MRLHQLAAAVDLPVTSVKHHLREGLLPPGEKVNATTARCGEAHVQRLELIRELRRVVGMGTEGIRQVVAAVEGEPPRRMRGRVQTLVALHGGDAQAPVADGTAASAAGEAPAPAWAALGPDPSPDQLARYVAVGVHAHAQLLLRLPAVAQGHHARAGAPGPSAPSRGH